MLWDGGCGKTVPLCRIYSDSDDDFTINHDGGASRRRDCHLMAPPLYLY